MISWSLTLTGLHINILRELAMDEHSRLPKSGHVGQWRLLMREGLIEHKGKDEPYKQGYTGFYITKRGRFILNMVEQDIAKYLQVKKGRVLKLAVNE